MEGQNFLAASGRSFTGLEKGDLNPEDVVEYSFVQMADPQLGMMSQMKEAQKLLYLRTLIKIGSLGFKDGKKEIPVPVLDSLHSGQTSEELFQLEVELSKMAVNAINAMEPKPVFAVVCGDLVHAFPNKDPEKNKMQVEAFKDVFSQVDSSIKLVCLCGNHDVGEAPSKTELDLWKERFGDDYFSFWVGKDKYVVLNSQMYKNNRNCPEEAKEQDIWLTKELSDLNEDCRHAIAFSHIPPFIQNPDEASGYFPLERDVRLDLLERLLGAGVSHWFCGHYHRNSVGTFDKDGKTLEVVVTGAVGGNIQTDPEGDPLGLTGMKTIAAHKQYSGLRVVRVTPEGLFHDFQSFEQLGLGS